MNVLVANDYPLMVDGLASALHTIEPQARVLQAQDMEQALEVARSAEALDLVILALRLPGMEDLRGIKEFVTSFPDVPVVITADQCSRKQVKDCVQCGAMAYIPKSFSKGAVAGVLKLALEGQSFIPAPCFLLSHADPGEERIGWTGENGRADASADFTPKERQVLGVLLTGASNRAIASTLGLEEPTVKFHLRRIFRKLGTKNRAETIRYALLNGWHQDQPGGLTDTAVEAVR